ncbi:MAG TPA: ImmA/IrrE family metallo-endopeptidase [Candidatus Saccharimonadales bacterium]|jgi:hypothetical protein|nr:ImmA/IrrE family metallo-endopeptidase [Candidatus Saccharimonadales bacterium]
MSLNRGPVFARMLIEELGGLRDVFSIATELRLEVRWVASSGFEGALVRPTNIPVGLILVRDSIREPGRKAFTVAHEIGHFVIPGHDQADLCTARDIENWSDDAKELEREADEFAAELLMPKSVVQPMICSERPSLTLIERIAQATNASLSAAGRRYCDLTSERCAFVWSTRGVVSWSKCSAEFAHRLYKGTEILPGTFAFDCFKQQEVPRRPEPVDADLWLASERLIPGSKLYEDSRFLRWYESVVSLLWIDKHIEKYHEDDDALLKELDPSDFELSKKRWPGRK